MSRDLLISLQQSCDFCKSVQTDKRYVLEKGLLLTKKGNIVAPVCIRQDLLRDSHNQTHRGASLMKKLLRRFSWPFKDQEIQRYVEQCAVCLYTKPKFKRQLPIGKQTVGTHPLEVIFVDLIAEIGCEKVIFTYFDTFSAYATCLLIDSKNTPDCIAAFLQTICAYGIPCVLMSDNEKSFRSKQFQEMLQSFGIRHIPSTTRHPQSKGCIENFQKRLKQNLRSLLMQNPAEEDFLLQISKLLYIHNVQPHPHSSLGYSLRELFFGGRVGANPHDHLIGPIDLDYSTRNAEFDRINRYREAQRKISLARINDKRQSLPVYEKGSLVLVETTPIKARGSSSRPIFDGPYVVMSSMHENYNYTLRNLENGRMRHNVYAGHLIPFRTEPSLNLQQLGS